MQYRHRYVKQNKELLIAYLRHFILTSGLVSGLLFMQTVQAEIKTEPSLQLNKLGEGVSAHINTGINKNTSAASSINSSTNQHASTTLDAKPINSQKVDNLQQTLRCWQNGQLILAEHNWSNVMAHQPLLSNQQQQKIYAFDYGETFCIYLGD